MNQSIQVHFMERHSCHRLLSLCHSEGDVKTLDIQSTPDNSDLQGKSKKVRVIGSSTQITGSKEISKWMGRECN